jgi:hypothetical protein
VDPFYLRALMRVANSPRLLAACIIANLIVCGEIFGLLEGRGPVTAVWWAIVTGSTVGYGDQYPVSTAGRGVAAWLIVTSILLVAVGTAQLSSKLIVDRNVFTNEEQEQIKHNQEVHAEQQEVTNKLLASIAERLGVEIPEVEVHTVLAGRCICVWNDQDQPDPINPQCSVHAKVRVNA